LSLGLSLALVVAALAICAITAAQLKSRTDARAPRLVTPASRSGRPGRMIRLALAEITCLPAASSPTQSGPAIPRTG
jgi:hypothetical protein